VSEPSQPSEPFDWPHAHIDWADDTERTPTDAYIGGASKRKVRRLGDVAVIVGLWAWLTFAVGPWYVGVGLMVLGTALNSIDRKWGKA
jgi:hypothetical protein